MKLEQQIFYALFDSFGSGLPPLTGSGLGNLYVRPIPSLDDELHVHPSNGYAKLKKSGRILSNYEAAMLDLRGEIEGGESKGDKW